MANIWFRMYAEFATDPKVQVLTEALQRRYVMLLCMQCNNNYANRPDDEIALALRITLDELIETKETLKNRGLLFPDGSINGWEKRQYISDLKDPTAANRQKRYRENKKQHRNATVTSRLPESDTDTETDNKNPIAHPSDDATLAQKIYSKQFMAFWDLYPRKKSKGDAAKAFKKVHPSDYHMVRAGLEAAIKSADWLKDGGQYIPYPATWLRARGWEDAEPSEQEKKPFDMDDFLRSIQA